MPRLLSCACVVMAAPTLLAWPAPVEAAEFKASGRLMAGAVLRVEARDPQLLTPVNANVLGLAGFGSGGNADDANLNTGRGDLASGAVKANLDLAARAGRWSALVRIKAWHDAALARGRRPWGNSPNGYAPNAALGDAGAPRLARFSGLALGEAWLEYGSAAAGAPDGAGSRVRVGRQSLNWGERAGAAATPGGLEALDPKDLPALHRAGSSPAETRIGAPMLSARLALAPGAAVEAYYQYRAQPTVPDMCGTLWSLSDYLAEGCNSVMAGQPALSDRDRSAINAVMQRLPTPAPRRAEYGLAWRWQGLGPGLDAGLYHARYTARSALPSLRRSSRVGGPALIPGNPDGRNIAYFTEYVEGLTLTALSLGYRGAWGSVYGEASYRPRQPLMLAPGDVLPPFLNASAPALLRAAAEATAPGAVFHGYDTYPMQQLQVGVIGNWQSGTATLAASAELVGKHLAGLPDPALRRYGRADIFGTGPVAGLCNVNTGDAARQCSLRGYVTPNSWGYRLRLDLRLAALAPQLAAQASIGFAHDVRGWAGDFLLNEGRRNAVLGLRFDYRQRYLLELAYQRGWGGQYNQLADRDVASLAMGLRF